MKNDMHGKKRSNLKSIKSCVLYDPEGKVVHIHEYYGEGKASAISNESLEKLAFNSIVKRPIFGEERPIVDASKLKVLHVRPESILHNSNVTYQVDLTKKTDKRLMAIPVKTSPLRSYANEVSKLADLKASGAITQEEFVRLKERYMK
jgi:hypothetical protein